MSTGIRLFESSTHAKAYSKFRPTHPKEVFEKIISFTRKHSIPLELAVDIACGSGQSTHQLSPHCQKVIGTDISPAQIACAQLSNTSNSGNVSFQVAPADKLPFDDESVSLVTCGQAWHWIEPLSVNPEILRVLRRPGAVAIYGHILPLIAEEKCKSVILDFYSRTLRGYWHENRKLIDDRFHSVTLPLPISERHDIDVPSSSTLDDYIGYVDTWSGYQAYLEAHPGTNVLSELKESLKQSISPAQLQDKLPVVTSYFLLLCLKN